MKFRVDYVGGHHCTFVNSRTELLTALKDLDGKAVEDIRKLYSSGVSDSVLEKYEKFIEK